LLEEARVGHLGLLDDDDRPRVLPVTYALWEGSLWSAVDAKPKRVEPGEVARVRFLRRRPEAALTVDRYSEDWSSLAWVQVLGSVEIVAAAGAPEALDALARRYEPYRSSDPPGPLLRLVPRRCLHWRAKDSG
jgi:PPOX class probable F420-dependent enzyme